MIKTFKKIYKEVKKYNNIVIARHIGADPDALGASFALRDVIKNTFPNKNVYVVGMPASRFKYIGIGEKLEEIPENALLIVLDTPDIKRIDGANLKDYKYIIKIDHHPFIESFGNIELIDDTASSVSQIILEFIFNTPLKLTKEVAEKLFIGIASDTSRFLHEYTTLKTFKLVTSLIEKTNINFTSLYPALYMRPLSEVKFQGYVYQNISLTENGVAHIKITDDLLREFEVDSASAGNMVNELNFVDEILIWVFLSEDKKSNLIRANIRSRGPAVNDLACRFGGGGHKYASGARLTTWEQGNNLIEALDELAAYYNSENIKDKK